MSEGKRITFADIKRQMELASEDIETWPTWMRRAAGLDGEGPDYNTLRAENARLREAVVWALGYTDFRAREHGEGPYWWRVELRLRSKLTGEQIDATLAALQPERGKP